MAKLIKKNKCEFVDGHIVKKNEIIGLPYEVTILLRKLELTVQQWQYLRAQPEARPMPSLGGFEFRSRLHANDYHVDRPDTPTMDARVAEAMSFCEEADRVSDVRELNRLIDQYEPLLRWCDADKFVPGRDETELDLAELGDPLLLEPGDIVTMLEMMVNHPAVALRASDPGLCIDVDGDLVYKKALR